MCTSVQTKIIYEYNLNKSRHAQQDFLIAALEIVHKMVGIYHLWEIIQKLNIPLRATSCGSTGAWVEPTGIKNNRDKWLLLANEFVYKQIQESSYRMSVVCCDRFIGFKKRPIQI